MAFGDIVQSKTNSTASGTSIAVTFDSGVTAGNLILLWHHTGDGTGTAGTGMSTALAMLNSPDADDGGLFYRVVITADGATWGADSSGADEHVLIGYEIEGSFAASPLDQTAYNPGNPVLAPADNDLTTGTTGTTAQADEFAAAFVMSRDAGQTIASLTNGFVDRGELTDTDKIVGAATKVLTATGTVETTWTFVSTPVDDYLSGVATFKKAAGGIPETGVEGMEISDSVSYSVVLSPSTCRIVSTL